jgi:hypothetical protein
VTRLDDLVGLDLLSLVSRLVEEKATLDRSLDGRWRSVLELFTRGVSSADGASVAGHEQAVYEAYGLTLDAAQRSGELDPREAIIRRVNLLVLLATRSDPDSRDELLREARVLVLGHLPMPLEVAREETVGWQALPIEEMRELRYVKNLLRPLAAWTTTEAPTREARALHPWLELLPSLP